MSVHALLSPGAGTQRPAMAADVLVSSAAARAMFRRLQAVCDRPLDAIRAGGRLGDLTDVRTAYPAVFATSLLAYEALRDAGGATWPVPVLVGGHSLGHFSALAFAGVLTAEDAIRLVAARARLMADAAARRPGAMLSIVGPPEAPVAQLCRDCPDDLGVVVIGCYNGPRQHIVSGDRAAVDWVRRRAEALPAEKVATIRTGLAAHSPLMAPAREALGGLARRLPLRPAEVPVLSNVTGDVLTDPEAVRAELADHVVLPVRWDRCLATLAARGVQEVLDIGPGRTMAALAEAAGFRATAVNGNDAPTTTAGRP